MSFTDPSSIILIVGAIAIFVFLIHGLYFSGRANNIKLSQANKKKLSDGVNDSMAKVRIVEASPKKKEVEIVKEGSFSTPNVEKPIEVQQVSQNVVNVTEIDDSKINVAKSYELNLVAPEGMAYKGSEIQEICDAYGILRGNLDIFYVYENPETKDDEVFRICSLEPPYSFPKDMENYKTKALALYMNLPQKGKGYPYFKSIRMAASIILEKLGGHLEDNYHRKLTDQMLDEMALALRKYDEKA